MNICHHGAEYNNVVAVFLYILIFVQLAPGSFVVKHVVPIGMYVLCQRTVLPLLIMIVPIGMYCQRTVARLSVMWVQIGTCMYGQHRVARMALRWMPIVMYSQRTVPSFPAIPIL